MIQMNNLYEYLKKKNAAGITLDDAVQLFLWLYCTTDGLPEKLRGEKIDEPLLKVAFKKLSNENIIHGADHMDWGILVAQFLSKKVTLDLGARDRILSYL